MGAVSLSRWFGRMAQVASLFPEGLQEGERELLGIEKLLDEFGYCPFDLYGVYQSPGLFFWPPAIRGLHELGYQPAFAPD